MLIQQPLPLSRYPYRYSNNRIDPIYRTDYPPPRCGTVTYTHNQQRLIKKTTSALSSLRSAHHKRQLFLERREELATGNSRRSEAPNQLLSRGHRETKARENGKGEAGHLRQLPHEAASSLRINKVLVRIRRRSGGTHPADAEIADSR